MIEKIQNLWVKKKSVHSVILILRVQDQCPHQNAPLCRGIVTGTTLPSQPGEYIWARDGEIVRCPWHGWEFDITSGRSIFNPHKMRVKNYEVTVEPSPGEDVESVESFQVTVEDGWVILDGVIVAVHVENADRA